MAKANDLEGLGYGRQVWARLACQSLIEAGIVLDEKGPEQPADKSRRRRLK
jgi:hypothetical protein